MKKILTLFTLLNIVIPLMSQENFVPGFVIGNQGDTLYGYINSGRPEK